MDIYMVGSAAGAMPIRSRSAADRWLRAGYRLVQDPKTTDGELLPLDAETAKRVRAWIGDDSISPEDDTAAGLERYIQEWDGSSRRDKRTR